MCVMTLTSNFGIELHFQNKKKSAVNWLHTLFVWCGPGPWPVSTSKWKHHQCNPAAEMNKYTTELNNHNNSMRFSTTLAERPHYTMCSIHGSFYFCMAFQTWPLPINFVLCFLYSTEALWHWPHSHTLLFHYIASFDSLWLLLHPLNNSTSQLSADGRTLASSTQLFLHFIGEFSTFSIRFYWNQLKDFVRKICTKNGKIENQAHSTQENMRTKTRRSFVRVKKNKAGRELFWKEGEIKTTPTVRLYEWGSKKVRIICVWNAYNT